MDDADLLSAQLRQWAEGRRAPITGLHAVILEGVPRPKARPRLGRHGTYQPDAKDEEAVAWQIREATRVRHLGPVVVAAVFYRPTRHRVDVDNLLKRLLDSGTKARLWRDDCQVVAAAGEIRYDPKNPRTVFVVADCAADQDSGPNPTNRPVVL